MQRSNRALGIALVFGLFVSGWAGAATAQPRDHDIRVPARAAARVGDTGALSLTIAPRAGYRIAAQAPLIVRLRVTGNRSQGSDPASSPDQAQPPAPTEPELRQHLRLRRHRYHRRHAADPRAAAPRFDLAYQAQRRGHYQLEIELGFWVCARQTCRAVRDTRVVEVAIAPAADSDPAADPGADDAQR